MKKEYTKEQKARRELLFKLQSEKQLRCGNGDGTFSHSINCACLSLDPMIQMLKNNIKTEGITHL
jgi:hypothetical protein